MDMVSAPQAAMAFVFTITFIPTITILILADVLSYLAGLAMKAVLSLRGTMGRESLALDFIVFILAGIVRLTSAASSAGSENRMTKPTAGEKSVTSCGAPANSTSTSTSTAATQTDDDEIMGHLSETGNGGDEDMEISRLIEDIAFLTLDEATGRQSMPSFGASKNVPVIDMALNFDDFESYFGEHLLHEIEQSALIQAEIAVENLDIYNRLTQDAVKMHVSYIDDGDMACSVSSAGYGEVDESF